MKRGFAGRLARLMVAVAAATGMAALAGELKLPGDLVLPQSENSPGPVRFSHATHVDPKHPRCADCHPTLFRILERAKTASGESIRHDDMEKGGSCGTCHGKSAFGFEDCTPCHQ